MNILLIPGHGDGDPGAVGCGYKEADLAREIVGLTKNALDPYCNVTVADTSVNWYRHIIKNGKFFNFKPYDYVLEVHFNSGANNTGGNGATTGTEIYATREEKTVSVEENIVGGISSLGFKKRGVKRKNFDLISYIKRQGVSSALLEVCFMDDKDDMNLYQSRKVMIAEQIANGIADGYNLAVTSLSGACKLLADAGIINSPDYWAKGKWYSDANTVLLIKKFAEYVRRKGK